MVRTIKKRDDPNASSDASKTQAASVEGETPATPAPKRRGRPPRAKTATAIQTENKQLPLPMEGTAESTGGQTGLAFNSASATDNVLKKPRGRRPHKIEPEVMPDPPTVLDEKAPATVVNVNTEQDKTGEVESVTMTALESEVREGAVPVSPVAAAEPVAPIVVNTTPTSASVLDVSAPIHSASTSSQASGQTVETPFTVVRVNEPVETVVPESVIENDPEPPHNFEAVPTTPIQPITTSASIMMPKPSFQEQVRDQAFTFEGDDDGRDFGGNNEHSEFTENNERGDFTVAQDRAGMSDTLDVNTNKGLGPQGAVQGPRYIIAAHPKPKYTYPWLATQTLADLRKIAKEFNLVGSTTLRKDDLIFSILRAQAESMNYRFGGGTLEILPEGFGFLRPRGMLPTDNDVYLSQSQIRRFGLRNGDVIWGFIRPPREQEHYEALLRVETVNFSDPESSRRRPLFSQLTSIYPNVRINLDSGPGEWSTRLIDMFAPIGLGQRALIVAPPKAGKTTILKSIAKAIATNAPDITLMALLIDERPEEVTDISRSIDGEVIASTFDRPADEHIRVANLALEKAKRLVEAKRDVVILLDSITRLARASNLTVPPSGRTLSGGLDPSGLYFPKRFFGAARNFEEGGSLTIIGTALTDTGSRMDDVIYEEFKGTGNMELHLSRKLAEQRIFPAIDITKSGTRKEELLMPEDELSRLWVLRKRLVGIDEAGALNLILDKLRQTKDNHEFLMSIKLA